MMAGIGRKGTGWSRRKRINELQGDVKKFFTAIIAISSVKYSKKSTRENSAALSINVINSKKITSTGTGQGYVTIC